MFLQRNVAYMLLITMLALIALGMVMLTSTSGIYAPAHLGQVYTDLRKQAAWLAIGGIVCVVLSRLDYHTLLKFSPYLLAIAALLLAGCFVPHLGAKLNGSPRWLKVAGWTCQPSEFGKMALVLFLAWWLGKYPRRLREFKIGVLLPLAGALPILILTERQEDYGTTAIMLAIFFILPFCAGVRLLHLVPVLVLGAGANLFRSMANPERMARLLAFVHQVHDGKGRQQFEGLIALGSGGLFGRGLGNSRQKMFYLPEVNTDFVFPIIGEELGLWVTLAIVLGFLIITLCSGWITLHAPDSAGMLLGTGITVMIALQALMNLAVITSLMPCKGIPLPFISYGGSNLLLCLAATGILFNLHRHGNYGSWRAPVLVTQPYSVRM